MTDIKTINHTRSFEFYNFKNYFELRALNFEFKRIREVSRS